MKQLKEDEIKGVIAHELGHIKHKDYIVMTVLSALPLIAYLIAEVRVDTQALLAAAEEAAEEEAERATEMQVQF